MLDILPVLSDALLKGKEDPSVVPPVVFDQITGSSIRCATLCTKGAAGLCYLCSWIELHSNPLAAIANGLCIYLLCCS